MMRRFALIALLSLSATRCGSAESNLRASSPSTNYAASHQRRELGVSDWWYIVLNALNVACPHDSTEDHPTGHCAHPSHHPPVHHSSGSSGSGSSGGGSSGASSSSGCTDDGDDDCWTNDGHHDDATADVSGGDGHDDDQWSDDGHTDDASTTVWADDGHTDDGTGWVDDGYTEEVTDEWEGDGNSYSYAKSSVNYSKPHGSGGGANGAKWAAGAGALGLVGAAAFVATKKRKRSDDDQDNNVPENVYVQEADEHAVPLGSYHEPSVNGGDEYMNNKPSNIEMQSVKTSNTRAGSIKSALSRGGLSLKNKFSRRNVKSAGGGDVGGYLAPAEESGAAFDHDSIASNEQQMQQEDGGVAM